MKNRWLLLIALLVSHAYAQCTFSPTGGTYHVAQVVTVTCPSGFTPFYTTDGSTPSIAGHPYTGPISITSTSTLNVISAKVGVVVQNAGATSAHWKCTLPTAQTYGSLSCGAGGGVGSINPSNVVWNFGSPMTETTSTTSTSGSAQILYINTQSSSACTTCDELVEDKVVTVSSIPAMQNNEMDANANMLTTYNQFHTASLQANQQPGKMQWQYDNQQGSWKDFPTPITFGVPLSATQQTEIRYGIHWTNGDTSCTDSTGSGYSTDTYDFLTVCVGGTNGTGGVCKTTNFTGLTLCGYHEPGFSQSIVIQDQHDMNTTGTCGSNPCTATRSVYMDNVTLAFKNTSTISSATYTISLTAPPPAKLAGHMIIAGQVQRVQ